MSTIPPPPDDDFSSVFESTPEQTASSTTEPASNLEAAQAGLSPEAREEILQIARKAGLQDDDPLIALIAALRRGDQDLAKLSRRVLDATEHAPERLREAAQALSLARADHEADVAAIRKAAEIVQESQRYTEKMSRCILSLAIGCVVFLALNLGAAVTTWVASEKAANFTEVAKTFEESSENVRKLQYITHSRLLLQAQENGLQSEWRKLQAAWEKEGPTEQLKELHERLKADAAEIDKKWAAQRAAEKEVLGK